MRYTQANQNKQNGQNFFKVNHSFPTLTTKQHLNLVFLHNYQVLWPQNKQCKVLLSDVSNIPNTWHLTRTMHSENPGSHWREVFGFFPLYYFPFELTFYDYWWFLLACCVACPLTEGHILFCADNWKHQKTHYWVRRQQLN